LSNWPSEWKGSGRRRFSCRLGKREFLSIKETLKTVGEADWVEARAWNQIGIHRRILKEQLREKIQVRGVPIRCFNLSCMDMFYRK